MASPQRRFMLQKQVVVDVGCGCRRSIFSTLLSAPSSSSSSRKQRIPKTLSFSSLSSTNSSPAAIASPFSSSSSQAEQETSDRKGGKHSRAVKRRRRKNRNGVVEESVAVVKESLNPYLDFYESILVMIMEKEMYGWEDLCELLHQYISLNSSRHHDIILRAFADIWKNVFLPAAEVAGGSMAAS